VIFETTDERHSGGGMYSSASDLAKFGGDILSSAQLSPSITRRWMKPLAHTSALTLSVGAPWEIWRIKSNISTGHIIDLYTKGGSIGLYNSLLILIPDYQVAVAILTARKEETVINAVAVAETVVQTFIPVLNQVGREEARRDLAGIYISDGSVNSSSQLSVDGMGLLVEKWISNGSDLLAVAERYSQMTKGGNLKSVRLYPTGLVEKIDGGTRVGYRALFETGRSMREGVRVFGQDLNAWGMVDQNTYGRIGVDDFVFELDAEGNAISIEPRVLRTKLMRTEF
jgi:CubicO group peptidase (beta-lactamase class C family)